MPAFTTFIRKKKYPLAIVALLVILVGYVYAAGQKKETLRYVRAERGTIISEVGVTGTIKPPHSLDFAFQTTGRIKKIYVTVGLRVAEGQTLASLDNNDIVAQLAQAEASVNAEEAALDQLNAGTKPEDIEVKRSKLAKAEQDLLNYYGSAPNVLNDAYAKANDAVRQQTDALFTNDEENNPLLTFAANSSQTQSDAQNQRYAARIALDAWQKELAGLTATSSAEVMEEALRSGDTHLIVSRTLLYTLNNAVQSASSLLQATITTQYTTYKDYITTALNELNAAFTNIAALKQNIASQKVVVLQTQNELNSDLAGNRPEQIAAQAAKVKQARANVAYYQAQLAKTVLAAPFSGVITRVVLDPGDVVNTTDQVVSLIGTGAFQVEANIAESDIARIRVGNTATVTLDAYGPDVIFHAKVIQIDLSSTVVEGVATYKATLQFTEEDSRILAGLTANVDILSDKKENVLFAPTRAIVTEDGRKYVTVLRDEKNRITEKVEIQTGLRGSEGTTEVVLGLAEGDKVVEE